MRIRNFCWKTLVDKRFCNVRWFSQIVDHYKTLGVPKNATKEEIKKAYIQLAMKYHPDRNLTNKKSAQEQFQKVSLAYDVLKDDSKKAQYDYDSRVNTAHTTHQYPYHQNPYSRPTGQQQYYTYYYTTQRPGESGYSREEYQDTSNQSIFETFRKNPASLIGILPLIIIPIMLVFFSGSANESNEHIHPPIFLSNSQLEQNFNIITDKHGEQFLQSKTDPHKIYRVVKPT